MAMDQGIGSRCADLAGLDSEHNRLATRELELTEEERALPKDPEWRPIGG